MYEETFVLFYLSTLVQTLHTLPLKSLIEEINTGTNEVIIDILHNYRAIQVMLKAWKYLMRNV